MSFEPVEEGGYVVHAPALDGAGFYYHHTRGSHCYFKHPDRPRLVPVPYHARDLKRGLLRAIIQQAGMAPVIAIAMGGDPQSLCSAATGATR